MLLPLANSARRVLLLGLQDLSNRKMRDRKISVRIFLSRIFLLVAETAINARQVAFQAVAARGPIFLTR
jgi:hypothetical protein